MRKESSALSSWRTALDNFVQELKGIYGDRLETIVLYGSRARGDAEEGSDIDTLVVLDPSEDFWLEFKRISPVANHLSLEHDVVISAIPVDARELREARSPLFRNVRREGVRVA